MKSLKFHKIDPVTDVYLAFSSSFLNIGVEHVGALNYFSCKDPASYLCHATKRNHHKKYKIIIIDDYLKTWTNTTLFEFDLAKSDIRHLS